MRQEIYDYIRANPVTGFSLSDELPWTSSGQELYVKNVKKLYVDEEQKNSEPIIQALDGLNIYNEQTTVRVFFSTDAKKKPSNYDALVSTLKAAKDSTTITAQGFNRRECDVTTEYLGDLIVTELEFRFTKLT